MRTLQKVSARGFFLLAVLTTGIFYLVGVAAAFAPELHTGLYLLPFLAVFALLCFAFVRRGCEISDEVLLLASVIVFILLAVLQYFCAQVFQQVPSGDSGEVFTAAKEYAEQGRIVTNIYYFDRSPGDSGLFTVLALLFSVLHAAGIPITMSAATLLNLVFIDAALLFMLLFVRRVWGNKKALLYLIMTFLFTPYILYVPIVYTDTVGMLFVTAALYLFACLLKQKGRGFRVLQLVALSLLLGFGTVMNGSAVLVLIAMIVYLALRLRIRRFLAVLLVLAVPYAGFLLGFDTLMLKTGVITYERAEHRIPPEFQIYTGLRQEEDLLWEDRERIFLLPDYEAKRQAVNGGIRDRLSAYGAGGLAAHAVKKAGSIYGDGSYSAGERLAAGPAVLTDYHEIFLSDGNEYSRYLSAANAYQAAVLIVLAIGLVRGCGKRRFDLEALLHLMLLGMTLFLMIGDGSAGSLLCFTPLMLALASKSLLDTGKEIRTAKDTAFGTLDRKRGKHTGRVRVQLKHALPEGRPSRSWSAPAPPVSEPEETEPRETETKTENPGPAAPPEGGPDSDPTVNDTETPPKSS